MKVDVKRILQVFSEPTVLALPDGEILMANLLGRKLLEDHGITERFDNIQHQENFIGFLKGCCSSNGRYPYAVVFQDGTRNSVTISTIRTEDDEPVLLIQFEVLQNARRSFMQLTDQIQHDHKVIFNFHQSKAALEDGLNRDDLTGAYNARGLKSYFESVATRVQSEEMALHIVFMDLDRFKTINDTYGHAAGDKVLRTVADRISELLRTSDICCRLGGDEFAILLPVVNGDLDVSGLMERVAEAITKPIAFENRLLQVGLSYGFATYPEDARCIDQLLRLADAAMYRHKRENHASQQGQA